MAVRAISYASDRVIIAREPALNLRPLSDPHFQPFQVGPGNFLQIPYAENPVLESNDAEADDLLAAALNRRKKRIVIAEHHALVNRDQPNGVYEANQRLLNVLGDSTTVLIRGSNAQNKTDRNSLEHLAKFLTSQTDHSVSFLVLSPCSTLSLLCKEFPELVAQKAARIVWLGGFTYRGEQYFTTHNLSKDPLSAQELFNFVQERHIRTYILSTDRIRAEQSLNFDLPLKLSRSSTPATDLLCEEIKKWNDCSLKPDRVKSLTELAKKAGYDELDIYKYSMTPADPIAQVFDCAHDALNIRSQGIKGIRISHNEFRIEGGKTSQHRKTTFDWDDASCIRFVDGFSLKGTNLDTTATLQVLLDDLVNRLIFQQQKKGSNFMATSVSLGLKNLTPQSMDTKGEAVPSNLSTTAQPPLAQTSTAAGSSSASRSIPASAQPAVALPKKVHLAIPAELSAMTSLDPQTVYANADHSVRTALQRVQNGDFKAFFQLREALLAVKVIEYPTKKANEGIREGIYDTFQKIFNYLNQHSDLIDENLTLSDAEKKILKAFATEGKGVNSLEVFTFPLMSGSIDDSDGSKVMEWSKGRLLLRPSDIVPGTDQPLGVLAPGLDKYRMEIEGPMYVLGRAKLHRTLLAREKISAEEVSEILGEAIGLPRVNVYIRGSMASGKSTLCQRILGIPPALVTSNDTFNQHLGMLAHNESCMLVDRMGELDLPNSLFMKPHVRDRDVPTLIKTKPGVINFIPDIALTFEDVKRNAEMRTKSLGRKPTHKELEDSDKLSRSNRPAVIEAARTNAQIEWHLINNCNNALADVAYIKGCKLKVTNESGFREVLSFDPLLAKALENFPRA